MKIYKNKYFTNTYWLVFEKFLRIVNGIFIGAILARYLGPNNLGILNYATGIVAIFLIFANLGLDNIVIELLVDKKFTNENIIGSSFILKLISGMVCSLVLCLYASNFETDVLSILSIQIVSITLILQSLNVMELYFQSKVESKYIVFANVTSLIISALSKVVFIKLEKPILYFVYLCVIEMLIVLLATFIFFYKNSDIHFKKIRISSELIGYMLKRSWPLILSGFTVSLYMKIDQIMIKEMLNFSELGIYSVAIKLTETWYFLPIITVASFFPSLANVKDDTKVYEKRTQLLYDVMVIGSLAISIVTVFLSEIMIDILYGDVYREAIIVLNVQTWATIFVAIGVAGSRWFILKNKEKLLMKLTILACMVNIILNYIFIERFGIIGASVTTLISAAISAYFGLFLFRNECAQNIRLITNSFNVYKAIRRIKKYWVEYGL